MKNILIFINFFILSNCLIINSAQMNDINRDYLIKEEELKNAVLSDNLNKLQVVFSQSEDFNAILSPHTEANETILMFSVRNKKMNAIDFLLKNGADITGSDSSGDDSIISAIAGRRIDILRFLLNNLDDKKEFKYSAYVDLIKTLSFHWKNVIEKLNQIISMLDSYKNFREEKKDRLKKISSELDSNLQEIMPKEIIGIIKQYSMETFEDYLSSNNLHFN